MSDEFSLTNAASAPDSMAETESSALLSFEESRVLGCLMEKSVTTPDYYPMTLNAVVAACNQRSNRSPVVEWDERTVEEALGSLRRKKLAMMISLAGARVPKFKHTVTEVLNVLTPATSAILCELMLRGRQTLGELRTNCDRMHAFADLAACESAVQQLIDYPTGAIVSCLPPGGGRKVKSYAHLLCGPVKTETATHSADISGGFPHASPEAHSASSSSSAPHPALTTWQRDMEDRLAQLQRRIEILEAAAAAPTPASATHPSAAQ